MYRWPYPGRRLQMPRLSQARWCRWNDRVRPWINLLASYISGGDPESLRGSRRRLPFGFLLRSNARGLELMENPVGYAESAPVRILPAPVIPRRKPDNAPSLSPRHFRLASPREGHCLLVGALNSSAKQALPRTRAPSRSSFGFLAWAEARRDASATPRPCGFQFRKPASRGPPSSASRASSLFSSPAVSKSRPRALAPIPCSSCTRSSTVAPRLQQQSDSPAYPVASTRGLLNGFA